MVEVGGYNIPVEMIYEAIVIALIFFILSLVIIVALHRISKDGSDFNRIVIGIFITGLFLRLAVLIFTPSFYAPDEQAHFRYIQYIAEYGNLPTLADCASGNNCYEYYQPPLYYLLLSPVYAISDVFIDRTLYLNRILRLSSLVFWSISFYFSYLTVENLFPFDDSSKNGIISIFTVSMIAFLPTYTNLSSVINNDVLLICLGSLIFYVLSKENPWEYTTILGVLIGLSLWTKASGGLYPFALVGIFGIYWTRDAISRMKFVKSVVKIGVISGLIWMPVAIRNFLIYGSFTATSAGNKTFQATWPSIQTAFIESVLYVTRSFWAVAGIHNNVSFILYWGVGTLLLVISFVGIIRIIPELYQKEPREGLSFIIGASPAIFLNIGLVVFILGFQYAQAQGRFLFPLLIPISLLMSLGLSNIGYIRNQRYMPLLVADLFIIYTFQFFAFVFYIYYLFPYDIGVPG